MDERITQLLMLNLDLIAWTVLPAPPNAPYLAYHRHVDAALLVNSHPPQCRAGRQ